MAGSADHARGVQPKRPRRGFWGAGAYSRRTGPGRLLPNSTGRPQPHNTATANSFGRTGRPSEPDREYGEPQNCYSQSDKRNGQSARRVSGIANLIIWIDALAGPADARTKHPGAPATL